MAIENEKKLFQIQVINGNEPSQLTQDVLYIDVTSGVKLIIIDNENKMNTFIIQSGESSQSDIKIIQKNGEDLPIVNNSVNIVVPDTVVTTSKDGLMSKSMLVKHNALRTIHKGTSDTPPSNWVDGDIYVQYE